MAVRFETIKAKRIARQRVQTKAQKAAQEKKLQNIAHRVAREALGRSMFIEVEHFQNNGLPIAQEVQMKAGKISEFSIWAPWSKSFR